METPIMLAPIGGQRTFHPEGELAVARAARTKNHLQILSTVVSNTVEDVIAARQAPIWYQLYPTSDWSVTKALVKRAEAAGCSVLVLTVDAPELAGRETKERFARMDTRDCKVCHYDRDKGIQAISRTRPMFKGIDLSGLTTIAAPDLTWNIVGRLQELTSMKLVLKGIVTHEDAKLCLKYGVDGIIVSNHGGRVEDSGMSTIESLPEVIDAIKGRIPVLVDSGFRRGSDIFKALALGAQGICIGRPYIWGLASFGQAGVEAVLQLLHEELIAIMRQAGTISLDKITRSYIATSSTLRNL